MKWDNGWTCCYLFDDVGIFSSIISTKIEDIWNVKVFCITQNFMALERIVWVLIVYHFQFEYVSALNEPL